MFLDQILDPKRKEIFQELSEFKKMAVLGGGTASQVKITFLHFPFSPLHPLKIDSLIPPEVKNFLEKKVRSEFFF